MSNATIDRVGAGFRAVGLAVDDLVVLDDRHHDRPVLAGSHRGRDVVVKCFAGSGAVAAATTAHDIAAALWTGSFGSSRLPPGLPRPVAVVAHLGAVVAERLDGPALGARGDVGGAFERSGDVARLLADLHAATLQPHRRGVFRRRDTAGVLRSLRRKVTDLGPTEVAMAAGEVVDRLAGVVDDMVVFVPTHGDFSPRNIIVTDAGLRLIDVDRVMFSSPARDVAYWRAWCWATQLLAGDAPSWHDTDDFAAAYADADARLGEHVARDARLYLPAGLLRIAHGWTALRADPARQLAVVREAAALVDDPLRCGQPVGVRSS